MPRRTKVPPPQAKAAFVAALRRGALVVEAAREAQVAVYSLYRWRRRDPGFDSAWSAAAEASAGWVLAPGSSGAPARLVRAKRRLRFAGDRRGAFLGGLEGSCDTANSARDALVHRATIYRHLKSDPAFALDHEAALERGYERLEALAVEERAAAAARFRKPIVPAGRPPTDFDAQMRILALYRQRPPRLRGKWRDFRRGPSFEETIARLERRLRHLPR